jgi:hypothetical protein
MATLHVRNVPDDLYEKLRRRADANGRSIGAETVVLLEAQLVMLPLHGARRTRRSFVPSARYMLWDAQEEARSFGHMSLGTEHLLLAILGASALSPWKSDAALALEAVGLDYAEARGAVERLAGRGEPTRGEVPLSPEARTALELALRDSLDRGDKTIMHRHLLVGIVRARVGVGAQIVAAHEPDADKLLARIGPAMSSAPGPVAVQLQRPFRVVELEGTAEEWERQLNGLAQIGYELVQVLDRRAIFSRLRDELPERDVVEDLPA